MSNWPSSGTASGRIEPTLDLAEVGHQHTLGPPGHLLAAVQPQTVAGPGPSQVSQALQT